MFRVEVKKKVAKLILKLDQSARRRITEFLKSLTLIDPRSQGKALKGHMTGLWRYRVGDYRIVGQVRDDVLTILILKIGHRKDIYRS